jgi:hypothetical protein
MTKKRFWLGIAVLTLVFGLMLVGCGGDPGGGGGGGGGGGDPDPLTGTVTVSSNITVNNINGVETMKLTADTSGLNGNSLYYSYRWTREGSNIGSSATYDVVEADYGKALSVKVTSSALSGEQSGSLTVQTPTICTVSVKYAASAASAGRKRVFFERVDGTSLGSTSTSLGTSAENVKLTSWNATQFKMRLDYTFGITDPLKYYFKKPSTTDELFDLATGTKSYTLTYDYNTNAAGYYSNLFATAE